MYKKKRDIYNEIKDLEWNNNKVKLINSCFFKNYKENNEKKYDLIIGNPPYFVMKKGNVDKKYYKYSHTSCFN